MGGKYKRDLIIPNQYKQSSTISNILMFRNNKLSLVVCMLLLSISIQYVNGINLKLKDDMSTADMIKAYVGNEDETKQSMNNQLATQDGNAEFDDTDVMAFTENAAGFGAGAKHKIKTLEVKKKHDKEVDPEDLMMNEDQAIAAFSMKDLSDEEIKKSDEPVKQKSKPKKKHAVQAVKKTVKKAKFVPFQDPSLPDSNIDMSSLENLSKIDTYEEEQQKVEEESNLPASSLNQDPSTQTADTDKQSQQDQSQENNKQQTESPEPEKEVEQQKVDAKSDSVKQKSPDTELETPSPPQTEEEQKPIEEAMVKTSEEKAPQLTEGGDEPHEKTIQEVVDDAAHLKQELNKAKKENKLKEKKKKEKKELEEVNDSSWGQMDTMMVFSKNEVTKAQGYEDPEPVEPKPAPPPLPKLSKEEQEKHDQDKIVRFSEFVAAEAEASEPVIKKEDPMEKPLHFKYFANDGEENDVTDQLTDSILGKQSAEINKKSKKLKYDNSDPDYGITPLQQVDYSKSKIDVQNKLIEPLQNVDIEDIPTKAQAAEPPKQPQTIELSVTS